MYLENRPEFERAIKQCLYKKDLKVDTELEKRVLGGRLFHSLDMRLMQEF